METKNLEVRYCDSFDEIMQKAEKLHREYYIQKDYFYMEKQLENIVQLLYNGRKQIKGSDTHNITTKSKSIL